MFDFIFKKAPFSFVYGGKRAEHVSEMTCRSSDGTTVKTVYDFDGRLKITVTARSYSDYDACDAVCEFENVGLEPTELISDLWDFDLEIPFEPSVKKASGSAYLRKVENTVEVYAPNGSDWSGREFFCDVDELRGNRYTYRLMPGEGRSYAAHGGRPSNSGCAPFFNFKHGAKDMGVIAAIGWTGQWNAYVERREKSIILKSRVEGVSLKLMPGERIRTSSLTLMMYEGDVASSQNKWRKLVREVYSPIGKGGVPELAPFCAGLWGGMSTKGCIERINKIEEEKLPFDHFWMDAGWYGAGSKESPDEYEGDWAEHTGNWEINSFRHPDLMADVTTAIKDTGKRFILWFEPERVRKNAPILKDHPEYFISLSDNEENLLLDLGNPDAWEYCKKTLFELIRRLNVSVYRQDFNFLPLNYWRKKDAEERRGITEIKHVMGLYRLWDEMIAEFPGLLIDNCASGGRRIDIETLRRSVPLWRSDAQCPADPVPEITQSHAMTYGSWMPYSGTGTGRIWFDTYRFRSAYAPAMTTNFTFSERNSFGDDPKAVEWLKKMCNEYLRVRPYLSLDIYPLTVPTHDRDVWSAVQYHDKKTESGVVQVFKRDKSSYTEACFALSGIMPNSEYLIEDADGGSFEISGDSLNSKGFIVRIEGNRIAKVFFYKKI